MFPLRLCVALLISYLVVGCAQTREEPPPPPPVQPAAAAALPSWFQFLPPGQAETWVSNRPDDTENIRAHGWTLWAALNQPAADGRPIWQTWDTSSQIYPYAGGTLCPDGSPVLLGDDQALAAADPDVAVGLNATNFANAETLELGDDQDQINLPGPAYALPEEVRKAYPLCVLGGQLIDGSRFQSNGDVMVANVVYNPIAADWLRGSDWLSAAFLDSQLPPQPTDPPPSPPFQMPANSIVLKPQQWPVQGGQDSYTALPVWANMTPEQEEHFAGQYAGYEIQVISDDFPLWAKAVAITGGTFEAGATREVKILDPKYVSFDGQTFPNVYPDSAVVSVADFYNHRYSQAELDAMMAENPCDRALLDASAFWAFGRAFQAGDYLVTIAMHMMTKEQPSWTFQSVWWTDQPDDQRFAKFRPAQIPPTGTPAEGPWDHYVMASTWGMTQLANQDNSYPPPPPPLEADTLWPVAFNTYIELAAHHPIATNCINCHHRAAWPNARVKKNPLARFPDRAASYLVSDDPGALDKYAMDNALFNGLVTLDAMWALSDRACYPETPGEPDAAGEQGP